MCTLTKLDNGFSLIELGLVAVIIGIMAAVLIPRFNTNLLTYKRLETASRQLKTDLLLTRQLATNSKTVHHLSIDNTTKTYAIYSPSVSAGNKVGHIRTLNNGFDISGSLTHSFTSSGGLSGGTSTWIQLSQSGQAWRIDINGLTGYGLLSKQ